MIFALQEFSAKNSQSLSSGTLVLVERAYMHTNNYATDLICEHRHGTNTFKLNISFTGWKH